MRCWLPLLVLVALAAAPARAQTPGVAIGWGDSPDHGGSNHLLFDCDANTASATFVVTLTPGFDLLNVTDVTVTVRIGEGSPYCDPSWGPCIGSAPAYWQLQSGGCREGALAASSNFAIYPWDSATTVVSPWGSTLVGVTCRLVTVTNPPWPTVQPEDVTIEVVPTAGGVDLHAGQEYYLTRATVAQTPRSPRCAGCCTPVVLDLGSVAVTTGSGSTPHPFGSGSVLIAWQFQNGSCVDTPVRRSTWGALKAVYR